MDETQKEPSSRDVPVTFYRRIQEQTLPQRRSNNATILACAVFVVVAVLLVLSLELGADIQQILVGAFSVAVVNLVIGMIWLTGTRRAT